MESLAAILGGEVGELPTVYLGMPLGAKSKSADIWNNVIERCEKKLARRKSQYLSLGGRLTLINSTLDALPTYMMSLFPTPARVIGRLDSINRDFLWNGNSERKKFHLVKWKSVICGKKLGGLGIKNLKTHSKALRMKWLWKYSLEKNQLWGKVIKSKYDQEDNWTTKEVATPYGVSLWKSIRLLWNELQAHSKIRVSNGNKTSFWNDKWHEVGILKLAFPDIYSLTNHPHKSVAEMWSAQGWDVSFRRQMNDWEIQRVTDFFCTLNQFSGLKTGEDTLSWQGSNKGALRVNTAYHLLNQSNQQILNWPWKQIWKVKIPYKVSCFMWLLAREAVLTLDNLIKRGKTMCSRCFMCKETAETVNHLFLHCKATGRLWSLILNLKSLTWVMPGNVSEVLRSWVNSKK